MMMLGGIGNLWQDVYIITVVSLIDLRLFYHRDLQKVGESQSVFKEILCTLVCLYCLCLSQWSSQAVERTYKNYLITNRSNTLKVCPLSKWFNLTIVASYLHFLHPPPRYEGNGQRPCEERLLPVLTRVGTVGRYLALNCSL